MKIDIGTKVRYRIKDEDEQGKYLMEGVDRVLHIWGANSAKLRYTLENMIGVKKNQVKPVSKYSRIIPEKVTYLKQKS